VKIATTAKDATLRTVFDNFNVVADKAMVAWMLWALKVTDVVVLIYSEQGGPKLHRSLDYSLMPLSSFITS
jgi:hypothetical protein